MNLIRAGEDLEEAEPANNLPQVPPEQEEASSPWGEFLRRRKINKQFEHRNETKGIQGLIHMEKT